MRVRALDDAAAFLDARRAAAARRRGAQQPDPRDRGHARRDPDRYPRSASGSSPTSGEPVAAAMRTPPYNLLLAKPRGRRRARGARGRDRRTSCRASSAAHPEVDEFVRLWTRAHEVEPRIAARAGRLRARASAARPARAGPSPHARPSDDRPLLLDWMVAFGEEVLEEDDPGRDRGRGSGRAPARRGERRLPCSGRTSGEPVSVVRLGRPDPERDPDRPGLHAARAARPRLCDRARRRALADAARRRPALLLPLHRPREPDVERDLRAIGYVARSPRCGPMARRSRPAARPRRASGASSPRPCRP